MDSSNGERGEAISAGREFKDRTSNFVATGDISGNGRGLYPLNVVSMR
jgi:hypothetical protein